MCQPDRHGTNNPQATLDVAGDVHVSGTLATDGAMAGASLSLGSPLSISFGGTAASTASSARANLGLGSMAVQNSTGVSITGGTIDGTTLGATTASTGSFTSVTSSNGVTVTNGGITISAGVMSAPLGSAAAPAFSFGGDADTGLYSPGANIVALSTGGSERLRASSAGVGTSGSFGIGTTTPLAQLSVTGSGQAALSGTGNPYGAYLYHDTGSGVGYLDVLTSGAGSTALAVRTYNAGAYNTLLYGTPTGSVGIGTSSPITQSMLTANGSISAVASDGGLSSGGQRAFVDLDLSRSPPTARIGGTGGGATGTALGLYVGTAYEAIHVLANGNVGIGTTSPAATLDLNGGLKVGTPTGSVPAPGAINAQSIQVNGSDVWTKSGLLVGSATNQILAWNGTAWVPTTLTGLTAGGSNSLPDARIGTIGTNGQWCNTDGVHVNCNQPTPNSISGLTAGMIPVATTATSIGNSFVTISGTEAQFTASGNGGILTDYLTYTSDQRLKRILGEIANPLDRVLALDTVRYEWTDYWRDKGRGDKDVHEGLIAQNVAEVMPEAVRRSSDGYYSVDYARLVPLLVASIKELKAQLRKAENGSGQMEPPVDQTRPMFLLACGVFSAIMAAVATAVTSRLARRHCNPLPKQ